MTIAEEATCTALTGEATQGGLLWGQAPLGSSVTLDGDPITLMPDGRFMLGFGRDSAAKHQLVIDDGVVCEQAITIGSREYRISRVEGVPQKTVTPPEEELGRIRRERALVRAAKAKRYARPDWLMDVNNGMSWPAMGRISGVYGSQRFYNGKPGNPHYGVDVAVPTGHPVVAPSRGIVTLAEPDLFYSGGTVILDHGYGLSSSFLHMSKISVSVGDELNVGDPIGEVGATGRATGPHLDWRMSWKNERIDPQLLVPSMAAAQKAATEAVKGMAKKAGAKTP